MCSHTAEKDHSGREQGERKIHQRPGEWRSGPRASRPPSARLRLLRARFIENRDAAERQKDHRLRNHSEAPGHQHVSDFVGRDASQHDPDQRQIPRPVG